MARPRKDQTETTDAAPSPRISVIDRRLNNPFGQASFTVPLKGEKRNWVVRSFVADREHRNRHYDAVHRLGWVPLAKEDIAVPIDSLSCVESPDGRIVFGAHGEEMLMAMPPADYAKLQQAKSDANLKAQRPQQLREAVSQSAANVHGDEAGEMTHKFYRQEDVDGPIGA